MNKTNEQIIALINRGDEIADYEAIEDFNIRERKICANIRVSGWIDADEVFEIEKKNNWGHLSAEIEEEFGEDRINGIYSHACEDGVSNLKEQYEGNCDLDNYQAILDVWHKSHNDYGRTKEDYLKDNGYYIEMYWDDSLKCKTYQEWEKQVKAMAGYSEWEKRSRISEFECWQYGRSGGWFSLCDKNELEKGVSPIEDSYGWHLIGALKDAKTDKEINAAFVEHGITKKEFISTSKMLIADFDNKVAALTEIINDIEEQCSNFKADLLYRLEEEMREFVFSFGQMEQNATVSIDGELVKTSLGASVPKEEFMDAWIQLQPILAKLTETTKINKRVGNYVVERAERVGDDVIIKAGCHKLSYNNIITTMT